MKNRFKLILAMMSLTTVGWAQTPTYVGGANTASAYPNVSTSNSYSCAAGNSLVIVSNGATSTSTLVASTTTSNTVSALTGYFSFSGPYGPANAQAWIVANCNGSSGTYTVTDTSGGQASYSTIILLEYSGISGSLDSSNACSSLGYSSPSCSLTASSAGDLLLSVHGTSYQTDVSIPSGYTARQRASSLAAYDAIGTSGTNVVPEASNVGNATNMVLFIALKAKTAQMPVAQTPTYVGGANTASAYPNVSTSNSYSCAAGNSLVIVSNGATSTSTLVASTTTSNTVSALTGYFSFSGPYGPANAQAWIVANCNGSSGTYTVTDTSGGQASYSTIILLEYSGISGSLDSSNACSSLGYSSPSCSLTASSAGDLLLSVHGTSYQTDVSIPSGYTARQRASSLAAYDAIGTSGTNVVPEASNVGNATNMVLFIALKAKTAQMPVALVSISVSPASLPLIAMGATASLTATGTYSDSSTQNLSSTVVWNSSNPSIATIANGIVTPLSAGNAAITASQSGVTSNDVIVTVAPQSGATWYVRPDGGTRYDATYAPNGQCDGKGDAPYPGTGINAHCSFSDFRYLYLTGAYNTGPGTGGYGWVIAGGDRVIIRGSIGSGVSYRIGWNNSSAACDATGCWGPNSDPNGSYPPSFPSGTASRHTQILGENYASCHSASAKTQLHGGYGVGQVLTMAGSSFVDVACLDITDFASCLHNADCAPGADYATFGVTWSNTSTHDMLTDVHIHGMAGDGMYGPTGDGVVLSYIDLIGNPGDGWDTDDGTSGVGSLLVQHFTIAWNGCIEQYGDTTDTLPYSNCRDDQSSDGASVADGFGTATVFSPAPGWQVHFDQGDVHYNTQDGLDALHLVGYGSSMTITRVLAYGNMGQQIKVGGANGTGENNVVVTNCMAMAAPIPGTPVGYNTNLSDFCRAGDTGVLLSTGPGETVHWRYNTVYSAAHTGQQIECNVANCDSTSLVDIRNNVFVGFLNNAADGYSPYAGGFTGDYSNPYYVDYAYFTNPASVFSNNLTFNWKSNWACPHPGEVNGFCGDPGLTDSTYHTYGYGDVTPASSSSMVVGNATPISTTTTDFLGNTRSTTAPTIGAYEYQVPH